MQNLTASEAAFLTSSATSQPDPSPVFTVTTPLTADTIIYSGEVPAVTLGGDDLAPGPLEQREVEVCFFKNRLNCITPGAGSD